MNLQKCTDEQLDSGTVAVLIKYKGIITVINKVFQICELAAAVQKTCPIDEGKHEIAITDTLPSYAPAVSVVHCTSYTVEAHDFAQIITYMCTCVSE